MLISRREAACATVLGALAVATLPALGQEDQTDGIQALIHAHNEAFTQHDLKAVVGLFTDKAILMGTAPGELHSGHAEIANAYKHMFADFDAGKQKFQNLWRDVKVAGDVAWMMAVSKVTMRKGKSKREFGVNLSVVCQRNVEGQWRISSMHYSNLVGRV